MHSPDRVFFSRETKAEITCAINIQPRKIKIEKSLHYLFCAPIIIIIIKRVPYSEYCFEIDMLYIRHSHHESGKYILGYSIFSVAPFDDLKDKVQMLITKLKFPSHGLMMVF